MTKYNVSQKLISSHLVSGKMNPGEEISIKIDQTLTQDATGTMVMLELEAMGLKQAKTEISAQYVDHNLLQTDFKNPDDHIFLQSACDKFGLYYSPAGNGVSHPVHMERFGVPGKTLLGSDSHTPAAGSLGMLAIGTGGLEVALAIAGHPFYVKMPKVMGIKLTGSLPDWVSAKDIILEVLRRHDVSGGVGKILEYYGPGINGLSAMDRHVIANMGAELGATTTVFPSDKITEEFLISQQRKGDWKEILADEGCTYDEHDEIDLSKLEPLIAAPSSPGNVIPVREVAGKEIYQSMIGSSANPGIRDFAVPALILKDKKIHKRVSLDINPTSRQILENLVDMGLLKYFVQSGARIHQPGCNGCIGMGQAPATHKISVRTVPRNFPGRSGTKEDLVYLCSPETAAASAIKGVITDPRDLNMEYPKFKEPSQITINREMIFAPSKEENVDLIKGPNIKSLPKFDPVKEAYQGPVLLKMGNNISTDEILPAGTKVLPFRSNIPEISKFAFSQIDESFYERAMKYQSSGFFVIAGANYGQGSSREHAAIAPSYLGLKVVIAKSYARIHRKNLINFGIVPFTFVNESDYKTVDQNDELKISGILQCIEKQKPISIENITKNTKFAIQCLLTEQEKEILLDGGLINHAMKKECF
ncbi:MAG: aconitate hydratase [Chlamydiae bacterium CG10_big_fil_rev_8_21_14_0_10_35_9]|nr:MAG: aconitate hydratase [Chlamydiae bacterium CG10_big_fil_rev_8_21_14_0_10_35_9]